MQRWAMLCCAVVQAAVGGDDGASNAGTCEHADEQVTSAKVVSADEHATNAWVRMWTMLCCVVVQAAVGAGDGASDERTLCAR